MEFLKNNSLTELEVIAREIDKWLVSEKRLNMIIGEKYYNGKHDILSEPRTAIGDDGELVEVTNLPDNRIVDNQYAKMVDQKTNYLVGNPFTLKSDDEEYVKLLENEVFNYRFMRVFKNLVTDAHNAGIGWLYPYYNEQGEFKFKRFKPYEILPFWKDAEKTELDLVVRVFDELVYEGDNEVLKTRVEIYTTEGIKRYELKKKPFGHSELIPDSDLNDTPYITVKTGDEIYEYTWEGKIPVIPFKYNHKEIPLIVRVKSIQDAINRILSNFTNNTLEDSRNTILVIHNYDGEDPSRFRHNLSTYGVVKVRSGEGAYGKVETLTIDVNPENYKVILRELKAALIENARGFDAKSDKLMGNPNQMNIMSMYSDIDLDSNGMETEFQASLEELMYFVNAYVENSLGVTASDDLEFVFNRDMVMNESEQIDSFVKSWGHISDETALANHPWVTNVEYELEKIQDLDDEMDAYIHSLSNQPVVDGDDRGDGDE